MEKLADAIAQRLGMSEAEVRTILQASLDGITDTLLREGRVQLTGFGVFELRVRQGRPGRNPRTGEKLSIPPTVIVCFKASPSLKTQVHEFAAKNLDPGTRPEDLSGEGNATKPWWRFWR